MTSIIEEKERIRLYYQKFFSQQSQPQQQQQLQQQQFQRFGSDNSQRPPSAQSQNSNRSNNIQIQPFPIANQVQQNPEVFRHQSNEVSSIQAQSSEDDNITRNLKQHIGIFKQVSEPSPQLFTQLEVPQLPYQNIAPNRGASSAQENPIAHSPLQYNNPNNMGNNFQNYNQNNRVENNQPFNCRQNQIQNIVPQDDQEVLNYLSGITDIQERNEVWPDLIRIISKLYTDVQQLKGNKKEHYYS